MKTEYIIKSCSTCEHHYVNHNRCNNYPCRSGEKWELRKDPLSVFQPKVESTEEHVCENCGYVMLPHPISPCLGCDHTHSNWTKRESEPALSQPTQSGKEDELKPSDKDIENAALDYIDEESNHFARDAKRNAYISGAKDMRDNNIYIAPKELTGK